MSSVERIEEQIRRNRANVDFEDALKLAVHYFGEPRVAKSSHHVFKVPWPGNPRLNLQRLGKDAKPYQLKDLITAIDKLKDLEPEGARSED